MSESRNIAFDKFREMVMPDHWYERKDQLGTRDEFTLDLAAHWIGKCDLSGDLRKILCEAKYRYWLDDEELERVYEKAFGPTEEPKDERQHSLFDA